MSIGRRGLLLAVTFVVLVKCVEGGGLLRSVLEREFMLSCHPLLQVRRELLLRGMKTVRFPPCARSCPKTSLLFGAQSSKCWSFDRAKTRTLTLPTLTCSLWGAGAATLVADLFCD